MFHFLDVYVYTNSYVPVNITSICSQKLVNTEVILNY